ncbi:hypothetical protein MUK42_15869 [Musa troglodytarum]|uniref:Uncharacterized protein n=1 Tax=Musa troglodytarum TaxID=320322 RepID=A0A9E7L245_9LILI|nr:hypothetical protein MUK42_15869 [Musa troglodytarum]
MTKTKPKRKRKKKRKNRIGAFLRKSFESSELTCLKTTLFQLRPPPPPHVAYAWKCSTRATDVDCFRRAVMPSTWTASIHGWRVPQLVRYAGLLSRFNSIPDI